jgi:hypothetical protein
LTTGSSWPYVDPNPSGYEAPDGVEATIPGAPDDAGSRDPSATTIAGAVANAYAQMREQEAAPTAPAPASAMTSPCPAPSTTPETQAPT